MAIKIIAYFTSHGPHGACPTEREVNMDRTALLQEILDGGIIAIVRASQPENLVAVLEAVAEGGVAVAEVTMTVPSALEVIEAAVRRLGDRLILGAGTILDAETCRAAILAGAEFVVSPTPNLDVIRLCRRYGKLCFPGAFSPTEVLHAWEAGADIVKVFPADVLGPKYLKAIHGPLPQILLMPTGGIDLDNAAEFLRAGACCLGVGGSLASAELIAAGDLTAIRERAARFRALVSECRSSQ